MRLSLLKSQRSGRLVANLRRSPVLDRSGIEVAGLTSPLLTMCSETLEGRTLQFDERLADNGLHLTGTTLHVHHHRDGHTTGNPLLGGLGGILHDSHVASLAVGNELGSAGTQGMRRS